MVTPGMVVARREQSASVSVLTGHWEQMVVLHGVWFNRMYG